MTANLENAAVATGLEEVSVHPIPKKAVLFFVQCSNVEHLEH